MPINKSVHFNMDISLKVARYNLRGRALITGDVQI
jgi:hypothetical protein